MIIIDQKLWKSRTDIQKFMENFLNKNKIQIKLYPKLLVKYKKEITLNQSMEE